LAAAQATAWAKDGDGKPTAKTVELFAVGSGTGTDDKATGFGCPGLPAAIPALPALLCPFDSDSDAGDDSCGCLTGSSPNFNSESNDGICKASLVMEVNFDFNGPTLADIHGIQNGTIADSVVPLAGRCYEASGVGTIMTPDTSYITLLLQGIVCDSVPTLVTTNHASFSGSYIINGGSGPYAAATGTGNFTASIDNVNTLPALSPMTFSATGGITALFSKDAKCGGGEDDDAASDATRKLTHKH
jgi:hypothetical protein